MSGDKVTVADDVRRRLLAGESLTQEAVIKEYGVSVGYLGTIVRALEDGGATFERTPIENTGKRGLPPLAYRLTSPAPVGEQGKGRNVARPQRTGPKPAKVAAKVAANGAPSAVVKSAPASAALRVPPPMIGADLEVCLLALDAEGTLRVGLRNGSTTWLATVDGYTNGEGDG